MSTSRRPFARHYLLLLVTAGILVALAAGQKAFAEPFSVNAARFDPYKNFKFRVKWDGRYVSGVSYVSPLDRSTDVVELREAGDPSSGRKSPGLTRFAPITIRRGVTHDTEFEKWANKVWNYGANEGAEVSLKDFRKSIMIELYNEAGQLVRRYNIYRCWPSEYQAMSELDTSGNEILIESLTLQNEGWERDYEVVEPTEGSFSEPK
jgi:phage tail-like protein